MFCFFLTFVDFILKKVITFVWKKMRCRFVLIPNFLGAELSFSTVPNCLFSTGAELSCFLLTTSDWDTDIIVLGILIIFNFLCFKLCSAWKNRGETTRIQICSSIPFQLQSRVVVQSASPSLISILCLYIFELILIIAEILLPRCWAIIVINQSIIFLLKLWPWNFLCKIARVLHTILWTRNLCSRLLFTKWLLFCWKREWYLTNGLWCLTLVSTIFQLCRGG